MEKQLVQNEYVEKIEKAFSETPVEVQNFIFSDTYKGAINGIQKVFSLNENQAKDLSDAISDNFLGLEEPDSVYKKISEFKLGDEKSQKLIEYLRTYVFSPILFALEKSNIDQENDDSTIENPVVQTDITAPSPSDMIVRLNQTLKQPTTIAPVRRDYSLEKSSPTPTTQTSKPTDPYRELPN